jgi:hypothetical protein
VSAKCESAEKHCVHAKARDLYRSRKGLSIVFPGVFHPRRGGLQPGPILIRDSSFRP